MNEPGRCWACGYPLHGLGESRRCPECGRPFDPADPRSTNPRRHPRLLTRWALSPVSWWVFVPALLALALVAWGTGWPVRFEDAFFPWTTQQWLDAFRLPWDQTTREWKGFLAGASLAGVVTACWFLRLWAGILARRLIAPPPDLRRGFWRPMFLVVGLLLLTGYLILAGQVRRIGHEWAAAQLRAPTDARGWASAVEPPIPISETLALGILRRTFLDSKSPADQIAALKIMHELSSDPEVWLRAVLPCVRDADVVAWGIRVLVMKFDEKDIPLMERLLDDDRPLVREAALDGLSILVPDIPATKRLMRYDQPSNLACRPQIHSIRTSELLSLPELGFAEPSDEHRIKVSNNVRRRVVELLLRGPTLGERRAAARVLVCCPPDDYRLRLIEWGVWQCEGGGLKMVQSELAGTPPFAHRSRNPIAEPESRVNKTAAFTMLGPVVRITASETMAVDLGVRIYSGKPSFAFPKPDAFDVGYTDNHAFGVSLSCDFALGQPRSYGSPRFDTQDLGLLSGRRASYPWLLPSDRRGGYPGTEVGFRWQSLVISTLPLEGTRLPTVSDGRQYAWWRRVREADGGWVSNQTECERFLCYGGTTQVHPPLRVAVVRDAVHFDTLPMPPQWLDTLFGHQLRSASGDLPLPHGGALIVNTEPVGINGAWIEHPDVTRSQPLTDLPLIGPAVEARLVVAIKDRGLNADETAAMVDCWRETFFARPGLRVLLLLSAEEYDVLCPLTIRPRPTERARVGIVWYELAPTK